MHLNYKIAGWWFWPLARRVGFSPATSGRRNENDRPLFLYAELKTPVLRRIGRAARLVPWAPVWGFNLRSPGHEAVAPKVFIDAVGLDVRFEPDIFQPADRRYTLTVNRVEERNKNLSSWRRRRRRRNTKESGIRVFTLITAYLPVSFTE